MRRPFSCADGERLTLAASLVEAHAAELMAAGRHREAHGAYDAAALIRKLRTDGVAVDTIPAPAPTLDADELAALLTDSPSEAG